MDKKLQKHIKELEDINHSRKLWLVLSLFVVASTSSIIFEWKYIENTSILWALGSCGITVSITWWYWTMRLIRILIGHRIEETEILHDLIISVREVNDEVRKVIPKNLTK